jgi:hypothetical protein
MISFTIAQIIELFIKNFNCKAIKTNYGDALQINSQEAFNLNVLTETGYVNNDILPLNIFNQFKLFNDVNCKTLDAGIFNNQGKIEFNNSPYNLNKKYPFIFNGQKILIPLIIDNELHYKKITSAIYKNEKNPENILILKIDKSKKDGGIENFLEYLTCSYFKKLGFITNSQFNISHSQGIPDVIISSNFISDQGFILFELCLLKTFEHSSYINFSKNKKIITKAGEAKSNSSIDVTERLNKYKKSKMFDDLFAIYPDKNNFEKLKKRFFNVFYINQSDLIFSNNIFNDHSTTLGKKIFINWLINTAKLYLLANLSNEELNSFLHKNKINVKEVNKFLLLMNQINIKDLYNDHIRSDN